MKSITYVSALALAALFISTGASAYSVGADVSVEAKVKTDRSNATTSSSTPHDNRGWGYGTSSKATSTGEVHRSEVATIVQRLLSAANRDGGIGAEVRVVAKEQQDNEDRDADAIKSVEARGGFKTFLIGTDYKSTGTLRSSIVSTENRIDRLTKAASSTTDVSVKADLIAQIDALKALQVKIDAFVKAHEGKFSLFGWFAKVFAGSNN